MAFRVCFVVLRIRTMTVCFMSLCMIDAHVRSSSQSERLSQLNRLFEEVDERRKVMHKIIHTFYTRQKFFLIIVGVCLSEQHSLHWQFY